MLFAASYGGDAVRAPVDAQARKVPPGVVVLDAHGGEGGVLNWRAFLTTMTNGHPDQRDDVLLDPRTLTVLQIAPLESAGRDHSARFRWPGRPAALAFAWPSPAGYSNLILDIPAPGRYDLERLVARAYGQCAGSTADAAAVAYHAQLVSRGLDSGGGTAERDVGASAPGPLLAGPPVPTVWSFTLDDATNGARALRQAAMIARRNGAQGWVRIVFDPGTRPADYRQAVNEAHRLGLSVLGQPVDSSMARRLSAPAYAKRFATWVDAFPDVEAWEVGNEVNGSWLGAGVVDKVTAAASYVKGHTAARTMLTLYWQLGEDDAAHSVFTWAHVHLNPEVLALVDELGLSIYPGDNPMGLAFERVMTTLHRLYPDQQLMIAELGYDTPDGSNLWWWGNPTDPAAGKRATAAFYQAAARGAPWLQGGTYWWYFQEDVEDASFLEALTTVAEGRRDGP